MTTIKVPELELSSYADALRAAITFFEESQQHGDDWQEEIEVLDDLLTYVLLAKGE